MMSKQRILLLLCILSTLFALLALWSLPLRLGFLASGDLLQDADAVSARAARLVHRATLLPPAQLSNSSNSLTPPPPSGTKNGTQSITDAKTWFAVPSALTRMQPSNDFAPRKRAESTRNTFNQSRGEATKSISRVDSAAERGAGDGCAHFKHMSGREFAAAVASGAIRLSDGDGRKRGVQAEAVRVVHVSWKTAELPSRFARWSRTWCQCFPHWTHVLWTDADNDWLVREHYAWFHPKYAGFRVPISRVDSVRYLYLHRFGGLYTDLDTVCYKPFEQLLAGREVVFGDMDAGWGFYPHFRYIQNSFMYSRAGHPFWLEFVRRIESEGREDVPGQGPVTGPYTLMNLLRERWSAYPGDFVVYPPAAFNPFSWMRRGNSPCRDFNRMDDATLERCIAHHRAPDTYVLEFHTETWRRGSII